MANGLLQQAVGGQQGAAPVMGNQSPMQQSAPPTDLAQTGLGGVAAQQGGIPGGMSQLAGEADLTQMEEASPEEEQALEKVLGAADEILFRNEQTSDELAGMLVQQDPINAAADVTALLVTQIDEKSGGYVPETVILPASAEILGKVMDMGREIGIDYKQEHEQQAFVLTTQKLFDHYGIDPDDVDALGASLPDDMSGVSNYLAQNVFTGGREGPPRDMSQKVREEALGLQQERANQQGEMIENMGK